MKLIPLTKGYHAIVDDEDHGWLSKMKWYASCSKWGAYAIRKDSGKTIYMHRVILGTGNSPHSVDHIDGNRLNNSRKNLRLATQSQNGANQRKQLRRKSCDYKGVHCFGGKWIAQIRCHRERHYLGFHSTPEDAALAYDAKARELFGEFARTNF